MYSTLMAIIDEAKDPKAQLTVNMLHAMKLQQENRITTLP